MKICKDCNKEKELSEFWKKKDEIRVAFCKHCGKIRNKKRYQSNKNKFREMNKKYYHENRQVRLEQNKKDYQKNRESRLIQAEEYRNRIKSSVSKDGLTLPNIKEKRCTCCRRILLIDQFYIRKTKNLYESKCRHCRTKESRLYRKKNKEKIKLRRKKYKKAPIKSRIFINLRKRLAYCMQHLKNKTKTTKILLGCNSKFFLQWIEFNLDLDNLDFKDYGKTWQIDHVIPCKLFNFDDSDTDSYRFCFHWSNTRPLDKSKNASKQDYIIWSYIIVQEIRIRLFNKKLQIDNVPQIWRNEALTTASLGKTRVQQV